MLDTKAPIEKSPWILWGAILTGIGCVALFAIGAYWIYIDERFEKADVGRTAGVVDKMTDDHQGGHPWRIFFHYFLQHDSYYTKQSVTEQTGESVHVGDSLPVKYLRDSPGTCRIDLALEEDWLGRSAMGPVVLGGLLGSVCVFFVWQYRRPSRFDKWKMTE